MYFVYYFVLRLITNHNFLLGLRYLKKNNSGRFHSILRLVVEEKILGRKLC